MKKHVGIVAGTGLRLLEAAIIDRKMDRKVVLDLPGVLGLPAIVSSTDLLATSGDLRVFKCPFSIEGFSVKQHWHVRFHRHAVRQTLSGSSS